MSKFKKDWQVQAKKWFDGGVVCSPALGGIGPGYEQAIQCLLWEILVCWPHDGVADPDGEDYPKEFKEHTERVINFLNTTCGFSGAQVGAARNTAYNFIRYGYKTMMDKLEKDRHIMVSKDYPHVPATGGPKRRATAQQVDANTKGVE